MDAVAEAHGAAHQRALDDLIERDRIIADKRLKALRATADDETARQRSKNLVATSIGVDHQADDASKQAERLVTDALLQRERRRADDLAQGQLGRHLAEEEILREKRDLTDYQLRAERTDTDRAASSALAETAAARSQGEHEFATIAHELRNPLAVISMTAQFMEMEAATPEAREAAQDVACAAARMDRLLNDLLDVARIESGRMLIIKRRDDAGPLLREVLRSYTPLFTNRGLTLTLSGADVPLIVGYDHDRIIQVLSNLLGNALKFVPKDGTVQLHVERKSTEIEVVVSDTGPGIPAAALQHLFERFYQHDNQPGRGLGLGLHLCEQIIRAHGGHIEVESEVGRGTTFRFTLPAG